MSKWCNPLDGYFMRRQQEQLEKEGVKTIMNADITTRDTIQSDDSSDGFIVDNTIIPKHIARRGRTTVVWWTDGSKTHVVLEEGNQDCGTFAAFCIAYAKRCFGSTSALSHAVDQADEERKNARARRLREEEKKACAEKSREKQEIKRQERERFIRMHMDEMCLKREAHRRLDEEGH